MKKTLLLLLASVALLSGCKKDEPADNLLSGGSSLLRIGAKKEVTCPACGAGYTVVCKDPDSPGASSSGSEQTWNPVDGSSDMWELKNSAGKYVRFYERSDHGQMKFTCACGREIGPFARKDFRQNK